MFGYCPAVLHALNCTTLPCTFCLALICDKTLSVVNLAHPETYNT